MFQNYLNREECSSTVLETMYVLFCFKMTICLSERRETHRENSTESVESNMFNIILIDSKTSIVFGLRTMGLGNKFMSELNNITTNDGRYTSAEYNAWLENDVFNKSLEDLSYESERIAWDE